LTPIFAEQAISRKQSERSKSISSEKQEASFLQEGKKT